MKKITFLMIALLSVMVAFAAGPKRSVMGSQDLLRHATVFNAQQRTLPVKGIDRKAQQPNQKALKRAAAELVTLPDGATPETYYTADGSFYINAQGGFTEATGDMASVQVAVVGTDIYVQGLAYWFVEGWIKGSLDGTTATFANGQLIGTDEYGDEFIVGSEDGETACDIVFTFDSAEGVLTAVTPYIIESASAEEVQAYCFWYNPVFTKDEPVGPEVVIAPDGLEFAEYAMSYTDYNGNAASSTAAVGIDGNDVYLRGFSSYIPEALIKGTKDGNTVTFPGNQLLGNYSGYDSYFYDEAVFTYDPETDTYTATGDVYSVLGNKYIDVWATDPVLKGVVEKAAMPANPEIISLESGNYGWFINFNVPNVDVNGDGMVSSKLSYIIYTDIEGDVAPLTFTPQTHTNLTEDMTEIPYGFSENYDFYSSTIYLNDLYSDQWNKIGIQSIYTGGGEKNATEIQWFDIKPYSGPEVATFNFNKMDVATSATGVNDGDITEALALTEGAVTLTVSPSTSNTPNRFWSTSAGPQLRVYSGTLTFEVPEGKVITQIVFNHNGKWGANTVEGEAIPNDAEAKAATWTGEAQTVVVAIAANSQINSIDVTVDKDASIAGFDFEDGTLQGWTTIDADGDGYDWTVYSGNVGHNGSTTAVMSQSYANGVGALTPDNYLVSPKVKLEGALMFYACAQDASYPEEHFGVLVSTKGNTDPEDFEMLQEWTMTASRTDSQPASARGIFRSPSKVQGNWYQYIVDLSSFEGQEGYVAIRHFNCTDMFYLLVDDITFGPAPDFIITPAEGVVKSFTDFDIKFNNYDITLAEDASASLINETTMTTYATNGFTITDNTLHVSFAESSGEITEPGNYTLSITGVKNEEGEVALEFYYTIEEKPELVELPEGVEPEEFTLTATGAVNSVFGWSEQTVEETRLVAFDGNDVYVQGLAAQYFPDGFVKGTLNENNQVVFKSGQLVGEDEEGLEFIVGFTVDEESNIIYEPEFVFDFDAETRTLTLADDFYIGESAYADQAGIYAYLEEAVYTEGGLVLPPLVELPEGVEAQAWALEGFFSDGESGNDVARAAEVAFDGNDIYVKGLSYYFEEAWLKGTVADGIATFPSGQFVGRDEYGKEFMMGFDDEENICDIEYAYDAEAKTLKQVTKYVADNNGEEELNPWGFWVYSIFYEGEPAVQEPVALPEGLQTESYLFTAMEISSSEDDEEADDDDETSGIEMESYSTQVEVAFDGSDVYFQGFTSNTTGMWMKGTLSEDGKTVTIPANQYMGFISSWFSIYDFYVTALTDDLEGFEDIVLNYDAENNRFSTDQIIATNGSKFLVYPYQVFAAVDIEKIAEFAATPADPEIDEVNLQTSLPKAYFIIPAKDTEGNVLLASKLFYTVWVEKDGVQQPYTVTAAEYTYVDEDMVEIPYNYDDNYDIYRGGSLFYFNPTEEAMTFTNVGIQSIYYGGGERNATDIIWLDGTITTGIKDINTANAAVYFDLQGRKVTGAQKGLLIKQTEQNGVVKTVKVVRK